MNALRGSPLSFGGPFAGAYAPPEDVQPMVPVSMGRPVQLPPAPAPRSPSPAAQAPAPARVPSGGPGIDFSAYEARYGLPSGYLARTAQIESGGNPNARNPKSSAGGLFQFIDSTARQYGLADKFDPYQATDAAARLAVDNAAQLRRVLGREPTPGELYLAHQQGGGGASKLLANPGRRAADVVGADAVRLNGGSMDMTAGEFAAKWISKLDGMDHDPAVTLTFGDRGRPPARRGSFATLAGLLAGGGETAATEPPRPEFARHRVAAPERRDRRAATRNALAGVGAAFDTYRRARA